MAGNVTLRLARRADISELAGIANAGNAQSALHRRMAPRQDDLPLDYHRWRVNIFRERFATPNLRTVVAENADSGELLGVACWAVEGSDTALYKRWVGESTWADWVEGKLVVVERTWDRWVMDKSIDYAFLSHFLAAFLGRDHPARPPCLHCHMIVVKPSTQSRGVGSKLIDWAKQLSVEEDLPLFLEATLEATAFYEKGGFARLSKDVLVSPEGQEPIRIPAFVWEGEQRQGDWLERVEDTTETGQRFKWRDDVLSQ